MRIEFKIGDQVICKKDYRIKKTDISFIKNKIYIIEHVGYWDEEKKIIMYEINNWSIISTLETHNLYLPNFKDLFYTKQEMRKLKINKIQD